MEKTLIDLNQFRQERISFNQPKIVGYFSLDNKRNYRNDTSQLRYYSYPQNTVNFDLKKGFETYVKKTSVENDFNNILRFIVTNFSKVRDPEKKNSLLKYDFISFRGLLTKLMITPFCDEDWTICAIRFEGTLYLIATNDVEPAYPNKEKFTYWGHKFERYVFSKQPGAPPDTESPVVESEEFCVMFSSRVNDKRVLYGAEVDGVLNTKPLDPKNFCTEAEFAEVKTHKELNSDHACRSLRDKNVKWWCQSYLVGIKDIHVGFRNHNGIVRRMERFAVMDLPEKCKNMWSKHGCLTFLNEFMRLAKDVTKDCNTPDIAWEFRYSSVDKKVVYSQHTASTRTYSLPAWYLDEIKRLRLNI